MRMSRVPRSRWSSSPGRVPHQKTEAKEMRGEVAAALRLTFSFDCEHRPQRLPLIEERQVCEDRVERSRIDAPGLKRGDVHHHTLHHQVGFNAQSGWNSPVEVEDDHFRQAVCSTCLPASLPSDANSPVGAPDREAWRLRGDWWIYGEQPNVV